MPTYAPIGAAITRPSRQSPSKRPLAAVALRWPLPWLVILVAFAISAFLASALHFEGAPASGPTTYVSDSELFDLRIVVEESDRPHFTP